jgi:HEPN domain-containing protein
VGNARTLTQAELLAVIPAVAEEITQDVLLRAWLRADFADTKSRLELGRLAYHYSRAQASRPEALAEFRKLLQSKGFQGPLLRVGEFIRAYWVAQVYGFEAAQKLRYSTLRALMSTLQRNGTTGTYEQKHRCAKNAKQLWEQIQERNLSAAAVQSAVEKMLPRTARKKRGDDAKRRAFLRLLKKLEELEGDEVVAALALLQRRVEEQSANHSKPATPAEPPRSAAA